MRLALLATLALAFVATAAAAATSPTDIYRAAIKASAAQRSVHYVASSKIAGNTEVIVGDAARDRGIQRITFSQGGTTGHLTVIVVANTAYVRGDRFTMLKFLGLTPDQASRYAGRWFFLKPPRRAYTVVAEAVRMQSFVAELEMPAPYTPAPATTIAGRQVTGVRSQAKIGGQTATVTLYLAAGSPLPVAQVASGPTGSITTTLGPWNNSVAVTAPHGALAFS